MQVSKLGKMPFGIVQRPIQPTILRRFLQRLKEREEMLLFKFSKVELDKGKKAEMREKVRVQASGKPDYPQIQRERQERKRVDKLVEQVLQRLREFLEQVRVGLLGSRLERGGGI